MRSSRPFLALAALVASAASAGCMSAQVTYPYAPVPVLISRVDRIGSPGPTAAGLQAQPVAPVTGEVRQQALGASGGAGSSYSESSSTDSGVLTAHVLLSLPRGAAVTSGEVRLTEIEVWAYSAFHFAIAAQGSIGAPRGTIVRLLP